MEKLRTHLAVTAAATFTISLGAFTLGAGAVTSHSASACRAVQLQVGMDRPPGGSSAGSTVVTFLVANVSKATCSLHGFPSMKFDATTSPRPAMKIKDSPSRTGRPAQLVTLAPHAVASFAMIYADAANQGIKNPAKYYSSFGWVHLPGVSPATSDWYYVATNFNLAYAGFNVEVSAIGPGPVPPAI